MLSRNNGNSKNPNADHSTGARLDTVAVSDIPQGFVSCRGGHVMGQTGTAGVAFYRPRCPNMPGLLSLWVQRGEGGLQYGGIVPDSCRKTMY